MKGILGDNLSYGIRASNWEKMFTISEVNLYSSL